MIMADTERKKFTISTSSSYSFSLVTACADPQSFKMKRSKGIEQIFIITVTSITSWNKSSSGLKRLLGVRKTLQLKRIDSWSYYSKGIRE